MHMISVVKVEACVTLMRSNIGKSMMTATTLIASS
jgi:hypothetical protein